VLDHDPLTASLVELGDMLARMTMVEGEVVHGDA